MGSKIYKLPFDIFNLNYKKIENLDGWGELSVSNLKYAINKSKNITLDKFLFSLGIRHIGQENAKLISESLKTIENLKKISSKYDFKSFLNIDGIGETQVSSLKKFFSNTTNLDVIIALSEYIKIIDQEKNSSGKLKNSTFMFTGKLEGISRAEAKSLVEKNSGKILSNVNSKLNYLVIGDKPTQKKVNLAKDLKIKIISQSDFLKILN